MPKLAHPGISQLSRLSRDHWGSHNNFLKIFFEKLYTLWCLHIFKFWHSSQSSSFLRHENAFLYIRSCSKIKRITFFGSNFINISENLIFFLLLNCKGGDSSFYDVTYHRDEFLNKNQILFQFSGFKTAKDVDRCLFGVLSKF